MRRFFVIFLILLFPLNVLALSLSVATAGTGIALPQAKAGAVASLDAASLAPASLVVASPDTGFDIATTSDLDPDEPPAGMDLHDIVDLRPGLPLASLRDAGASPREARRPWHALSPPLRPPRAA